MGDGPGASFETVYTMPSWYDGPREGIADYQGRPHLFISEWSDAVELEPDSFQLMPIDPETFALALEDWAIWLRWSAAFHRGETTSETHPALPEDRARSEELRRLLEGRLTIDPALAFRAAAEFEIGRASASGVFDGREWRVCWTPLS